MTEKGTVETVAIRLLDGPYKGTKFLELNWPPPEHLQFNDTIYTKVNQSAITDEQFKTMSHVMRGAEYLYEG